jgi:glycopeptide antibiotics resistance protein
MSFFPLVWVLVIVGIVVPWYAWQDHAHWMNVVWRPFGDSPLRPLDAALNVLLYTPLGWSLKRSGWRAWAIVAAATGLSLVTEATQVYSHSRVPSMTDVVCNAAGAWVGTRFRKFST